MERLRRDSPAARCSRFAGWIESRRGHTFPDYASLHRWSVESRGDFWGNLATFCDLRWRRVVPAERPHLQLALSA
jgi:hypothetical protein